MTDRPRPIEEIRASVLREIFALPSDRQTPARQLQETPEPVDNRHFRHDHVRWICAAVLEDFGYERIDDTEHRSMTFAKKFDGESVRFLEIRWDETTGLLNPAEDIVEIDSEDAPLTTSEYFASSHGSSSRDNRSSGDSPSLSDPPF
jgi:hypothetical protein